MTLLDKLAKLDSLPIWIKIIISLLIYALSFLYEWRVTDEAFNTNIEKQHTTLILGYLLSILVLSNSIIFFFANSKLNESNNEKLEFYNKLKENVIDIRELNLQNLQKPDLTETEQYLFLEVSDICSIIMNYNIDYIQENNQNIVKTRIDFDNYSIDGLNDKSVSIFTRLSYISDLLNEINLANDKQSISKEYFNIVYCGLFLIFLLMLIFIINYINQCNVIQVFLTYTPLIFTVLITFLLIRLIVTIKDEINNTAY